MKFSYLDHILPALLLVGCSHAAINIDFTSTDSIKQGAQTLATSLFNYYVGNKPGNTPGILPGPYYWWEAGGMFGGLIDYWYLTGDSQFNDVVTQAMLFQVGTDFDYMPANQTKDEGNDDQSFWGMAAMSAAENKFPNPPSSQPQWLALAQAVFNDLAMRWDTTTCGGGLRWQIFSFNNGYTYKNTISNLGLFNLGSRLGKYTGNTTYFDWASKAYDWLDAVGLISPDFHSYDGSDSTINCSNVNHLEWTYNAGAAIHGAANMWNATGDAIWQTRINGLLNTTALVFFPNGVMKEVACEENNNCDVDQMSFKAYLSRWLGHTTKLAPFTTVQIQALLATASKAAAGTCTGGTDGNQCGLSWNTTFDGNTGVGQQLSVLELVQANLQPLVIGPVGANTGGNSTGNPGAGGEVDKNPVSLNAITTSDKAGAAILTIIAVSAIIGGASWLALA